ncbi:hypothetical protein P3T76_003554 [Phytophthora citrophthora]|uniref:Uncharacterized protein n=1 Tax=Phytophthora citrophthora TaxID=4793 RepID=A0AAD9LQU1_9STRA|nr:hypothetical protein P3T76_003554 [Phytophthora citrophthora]
MCGRSKPDTEGEATSKLETIDGQRATCTDDRLIEELTDRTSRNAKETDAREQQEDGGGGNTDSRGEMEEANGTNYQPNRFEIVRFYLARMAAPEYLPEVIVISDNENGDEKESNSNTMNSFSWTDVANRLLLMAKSRELRDNEQTMKSLLLDLGIKPTAELRNSLHNTCEILGELLALSRGNNRRYRACEDLVLVVCEVLSLMQTTTCKAMATPNPPIKEEGVLAMDKWRSLVEGLARSPDSRAYAIDATMSHLETLMGKSVGDKVENESKECVQTGELTFMILDIMSNCTGDIQARFQGNNEAYQSVEHHLRDTKLHGHFYSAARRLVNIVPLVMSNQNGKIHETTAGKLGRDMLVQLESFGAALQTVMLKITQCHGYQAIATPDRSELLRLARCLEAFWLIYRNWLPTVVLETYTRRFEVLLESSKQLECPIGNALSRVCANAWAIDITYSPRLEG